LERPVKIAAAVDTPPMVNSQTSFQGLIHEDCGHSSLTNDKSQVMGATTFRHQPG